MRTTKKTLKVMWAGAHFPSVLIVFAWLCAVLIRREANALSFGVIAWMLAFVGLWTAFVRLNQKTWPDLAAKPSIAIVLGITVGQSFCDLLSCLQGQSIFETMLMMTVVRDIIMFLLFVIFLLPKFEQRKAIHKHVNITTSTSEPADGR